VQCPETVARGVTAEWQSVADKGCSMFEYSACVLAKREELDFEEWPIVVSN
jgi:hypothetical protein